MSNSDDSWKSCEMRYENCKICNGTAKKGCYQFVVIGTLFLYLIFLIMVGHQNLTEHFKKQLFK